MAGYGTLFLHKKSSSESCEVAVLVESGSGRKERHIH